MKRIYLALLIGIIFLSCEKGNDQIIERNNTGLLSKVFISGTAYMEYTYTSSGLIQEEKSWGSYTKHSYNSSDLLVKSESYVDPSIFSSSSYVIAEASKRKEWANPQNTPLNVTNTYTYNKAGILIQRNIERANGTGDYVKYELNKKGMISKETYYYEDKLSGYVDYSYDDRGNLITRSHYFISTDGKSNLSNKTEYEYDNKLNPYFPFNKLLYPGRATNMNNITKETYTLYGELPLGIEWVQVTTHTYEYNAKGYPVKVDKETVYEYE